MGAEGVTGVKTLGLKVVMGVEGDRGAVDKGTETLREVTGARGDRVSCG